MEKYQPGLKGQSLVDCIDNEGSLTMVGGQERGKSTGIPACVTIVHKRTELVHIRTGKCTQVLEDGLRFTINPGVADAHT